MVLYDVITEQLDRAMVAIAEKLVVMENEGLLREGSRTPLINNIIEIILGAIFSTAKLL